jgi:flagellar basal-body rod modification protein FlgD
MSHSIAALSTPGMLLPTAQSQMAQAMAMAKAKASTTSSSTSNAASSTTGIGSTFLNLLSTELQNQDPTAPVDSTAMVGQMISLNQLDQLISINQTLGATPVSATGGSTSGSATAALAGPSAAAAAKAAVTPALDPASTLSNPQSALPFDPNTMMPIATAPAPSTSISGAK